MSRRLGEWTDGANNNTFTYVLIITAKEIPLKGERLGEFEELVLLCVRHLGDDAHGVGIQSALAEFAGREVMLGAIYAALDRTQRKGFASSWLGEPTPTRGGRAKRHYAVSVQGEEVLRESRRVREGLWTTAMKVGS